MNELNLHRLQEWIDQGRLNPEEVISIRDIHMSNVCGKVKHGVKLLAKGKEKLKVPITIEVSRVSKEAVEAIEAAGGRVTSVYYNRLGLRAHLMPHKFERIPRRARPSPKIMPYYTSFENRGYLSPEMQLLQVEGCDLKTPKEAHDAIYPPAESGEEKQ